MKKISKEQAEALKRKHGVDYRMFLKNVEKYDGVDKIIVDSKLVEVENEDQ